MAFTTQQVISNLTPAELQVWNGLSADQKQTIISGDNFPNMASIKGFLDTNLAKNIVSQNKQPSIITPLTTSKNPNTDDKNQTSEPTSAPIVFVPLPNVLRDYASYVAVISWQATSIDNFNAFITSQKYIASAWDTICKTGGVGSDKATGPYGSMKTPQLQYFTRDLYIDDVTINTLCGMSQENRGTNATDIEFTVIEPFGMDLIENLYDYCHNAINEQNYCKLPYLLKIDFIGYTDNGSAKLIPNTTKLIPISLLTMDIKVNNMGAEYKISALAYNELGNTENYGRVPVQIQVGTPTAIDHERIVDKIDTTDIQIQNINNVILPGTIGALTGVLGSLKQITDCFTVALNNVETALYNNGNKLVKNIYLITYVNVSGLSDNNYNNVGSSIYLDPLTMKPTSPFVAKDLPMGAVENSFTESLKLDPVAKRIASFTVDPDTGETGEGAVTYSGHQLITFNTGSSIIDCLNTIIINSSYIVNQIKKYDEDLKKILDQLNTFPKGSAPPAPLQEQINNLQKQPLYWFKINSIITNISYDKQVKDYARNITYEIRPYIIYNARSISVSNGNPVTEGRVVKEYDYIFTGKNTEILNWDLNFNNAFVTYAQFNTTTKIQGTGAGKPAADQNPAVPTTNTPRLGTISSSISEGQATKFVSNSTKQTGGGALTPERVKAGDVAATVYSNGDQIQLDMTIFGDPDFIKQDGLFIQTTSSDPYIFPNSTKSSSGIAFDTGEIYANVAFKVPQDINLDTGLLDLSFSDSKSETEYRRNVFSGQYRILTVNNKFVKGLFTQQLNMARYDDSHHFEPVRGLGPTVTGVTDTWEAQQGPKGPNQEGMPLDIPQSSIPELIDVGNPDTHIPFV